MTIAELVQEFESEAKTTRRVLERVPSDKLTWTPHVKSMSLGTLAMHLASAPGAISGWPIADRFEFTRNAARVPDVHRRNRGSARQWRGTGEGESPEDRGCGPGRVMDGRRRRQDAHDDAEGGAAARTADESYLPSSRPAVGVSAAARCACAPDLWPERGRKSFYLIGASSLRATSAAIGAWVGSPSIAVPVDIGPRLLEWLDTHA